MSDEKGLATTSTTVAVYGESQDVALLQKRIMAMLPQVAKIGHDAAFGLAQVSLAMGLNPFIGEIWAIPVKGGGYTISGGIKGMRRSARRESKSDGGMYVVELRLPTPDEIDGLLINKGDIVRACDIFISGRRATAFREITGKIPVFTGIGIYRNGESTRMNPLQCCRKRAEADALKQAFDLPLAYSERHDDVDFIEPDVYDSDYQPVTHDVKAPQAMDELFGEYEHDGEEPVIELAAEEPAIEQDEPEPEAPPPAWVTNPDMTKKFYIWANNQALPNGEIISKAQIFEATGVTESIKEFTGTIGEAKMAVIAWIKEQS